MRDVLLILIEIEGAHIRDITANKLDLGNSVQSSVAFVGRKATLTTSVKEILFANTVQGQGIVHMTVLQGDRKTDKNACSVAF